MLLSVIIPVLNAEKYIEECLQSVLQQENVDLEILFVDAGSTDSTLEKAEQYAENDNRIQIIQYDIKSYGSQVNAGIAKAKGDYIVILESDDIVPPNAYEKLVEKITDTNADVVKGNYKIFITTKDGDKIFSNVDMFESERELYDRTITAREKTDILRKDKYLWKGIYSRDFLVSNNILLNETPGAAFQDNGFLWKTLILAKKIIYIEDYVYYYRKDNEGSSVYSLNGLTYVAQEYTFIHDFLETLDEEERIIYWPIYYLSIMDMVRTRCLLFGLFNSSTDIDKKVISKIQSMLEMGKRAGYLGRDQRGQKDLFEIDLFIKDSDMYMKYTRQEVLAEKYDLEQFIKRITPYKKINVWGHGKTGGMLQMILERKNIICDVKWLDTNKEKINIMETVFNAYEVANEYDGETPFIICAEKSRYEIRELLHNKYGVKYEHILFYTLGTAQYLLFM